MADYLVTTDFRAKDFISPTMRNMEGSVKRFSDRSRTSLSQIFKGSFLGNLGANAVTAGLSKIREGVSSVVDEYLRFDQVLNEAATKFGDIDYGSARFKELGDVAREVGRTTKFTSEDAAGGLEALAGAGFEVENALRILPSVANFAAAAKMDLAEATDLAGKSLNAFNMNAKDATTQTENLNRIADVLAKTDAATTANMRSLGETVSWAAGRFTGAGQEIQTFGAIAGALADVSVEGSVAGTVMKSMISGLTDLGTKGTAALKKLGMSQKDLVDENGNLKNVIDILAQMEEPFKKLSTYEAPKILKDIFDERAVSGITALLNKGIAGVKDLEKEIDNAGGTAKKMGDQLNQSLTARVMALQNALMEKGFQVFEGFLTDGKGGIENMIDAITNWDVTPLVDGLKSIGKGVKFLVDNIDTILSVGKAFLAIKAATSVKNAAAWGLEIVRTLRTISVQDKFRGYSVNEWGQPIAGGLGGLAGGIGGIPGSSGGFQSAGRGGQMFGPLTPEQDRQRQNQITSMKVASIANMAVNTVATLAAAYEIGQAIGKVLDEYLTGPLANRMDKQFQDRQQFVEKSAEAMRKGVATEEQLKEVIKQSSIERGKVGESITKFIPDATPGEMLDTLTSVFTGASSPYAERMAEANRLSRTAFIAQKKLIEKMPEKRQDEYIADLQSGKLFGDLDLTEMYAPVTEAAEAFREVGMSLEQIRDSKQTVDVNLVITGDGAERVKAKPVTQGGPNAPRVNVKQAGAN